MGMRYYQFSIATLLVAMFAAAVLTKIGQYVYGRLSEFPELSPWMIGIVAVWTAVVIGIRVAWSHIAE